MKRYRLLLLFVILVLSAAACDAILEASDAEAPPESADVPYTVSIDPADFVAVIDNTYFPRIPGARYIYEGQTAEGLERIEIEVLAEPREVMGVPTTVVRDTVYLDGVLVEDTFDWFAQDGDGNVWYFGEEVANYENGVLADHDGSWEAGVDGALPGIVMYADPATHVGETFRQEYYAGEAAVSYTHLDVDKRQPTPKARATR